MTVVLRRNDFLACGDRLRADGIVVDGSATFANVATIVLALAKTYKSVTISLSCFRDTVAELVHIDDVGGSPAENILWRGRVGCAQNSYYSVLEYIEFSTIGGTAVQHLTIRAKNINGLSDIDAAISVLEL